MTLHIVAVAIFDYLAMSHMHSSEFVTFFMPSEHIRTYKV